MMKENRDTQWSGDEEVFLRLMTREDTDRIIGWRNQEFVRSRFIYR